MVHNLSFMFNNFWNMHVIDTMSQGELSWVLVMQLIASTILGAGVGNKAALCVSSVTPGLNHKLPVPPQDFDPWVGMITWRRKWQPSSILAWRIPWTEEPGELQSKGLQRVRYD